MKLFLTILVIVAVAFVLLAVRVLVKPGGRFSSQHISQSKAMRERGITCANSSDYRERHNNRRLDVDSL